MRSLSIRDDVPCEKGYTDMFALRRQSTSMISLIWSTGRESSMPGSSKSSLFHNGITYFGLRDPKSKTRVPFHIYILWRFAQIILTGKPDTPGLLKHPGCGHLEALTLSGTD